MPLKWHPKDESVTEFLQFCTFCDGYKPPRSHHCRKCNRCCMKMDHHCIWLGKCVGFRNQASFMVFLFGAVFGALHGTIMIVLFSYAQLWVRFWVVHGSVMYLELNLTLIRESWKKIQNAGPSPSVFCGKKSRTQH